MGTATLRAALTVTLAAASAAAQVPGTPLLSPRNTLVGTIPTLGLDAGVQGHPAGTLCPVGLRGTLAAGRLTGSLGVSRLVHDGDAALGLGAGLGVELWAPRKRYTGFGGRLQAGLEHIPADAPVWGRQLEVPVALTLVHEAPVLELTPAPWLGPVVRLRRREVAGETETTWLAGVTAGTEVFRARCATGQVRCTYGFGARLAVELARDFDGKANEGRASLGLFWRFF